MLLLLLSCIVHRGAAKQVLGVPPEGQSRYDVGGQFACADGATVRASTVNDEFCDCADGSDEPGTGACAGHDERLFYCQNEGGTARNLYASRVGDGICDCCDGSDEASLAARRPERACTNTCAEQGAQERVQMEKLIIALKSGVEKRKEIETQHVTDLAKWKEWLEPLQTEVEVLNTAHEDAKNATAEASQVKQTFEDVLKPAEEHKETAVDTPASQEASVADEEKEEKKEEVVSEYAKWMDGAAETLGGTEADEAPAAATDDAAPPAAAETQPEAAPAESDGSEQAPAEAAAEEDPATKAAKAALEEAKTKHKAAEDAERDARSAHDNKKREVSDLQEKIDALDVDHLGYASLVGKTLELHSGEHTYKLEFFKSAKQGHTSLGNWGGFDGLRSAAFDGGDRCWNGPERKLLLKFICDIEEAVIDVNEPSRCVYEATVKHPGACDPKELEAYGGKRVVGPKDEL